MEREIKKPEVGMGVTMSIGSDSYPYEIVEIIDEKHLAVRRLDYKAKPNSDYFGHQEYEYFSREDSPLTYLMFRNNRWREQMKDNVTGKPTRRLGSKWEHWSIGRAVAYFDPSF